MTTPTFTLVHVLLSLMGIGSGFVVMFGLLTGPSETVHFVGTEIGVGRRAVAGRGRSSVPGLGRSAVPGLRRSAVPGLGRSAVPGPRRSAMPCWYRRRQGRKAAPRRRR